MMKTMTNYRLKKLNEFLDDVYTLMLSQGYDQTKLNKSFLIFNLSSQDNDVETFNWIFDALIKMNENKEYYEICSIIKEKRKWIK